jgi:methylthioribose-1-phosphate isomerase
VPPRAGGRAIRVEGRDYRTVWIEPGDDAVSIVDQTLLPFRFAIARLATVDEVADAVRTMRIRGAGAIGAAAGYGMVLAAREAARLDGAAHRAAIEDAAARLIATRPTAVNLRWAVERQLRELVAVDAPNHRVARALEVAAAIADEDVAGCEAIGRFGLPILRAIHERTGSTVNVLTHCNAGWLAFVDRGTATGPIYAARDAGIPVHVWVDETRPRNQGARLTAWELASEGVPHTIVVDGAGGHLMQRRLVDVVIVGTDRTSLNGDVANKIGTYPKALAARDNDVPFYAAVPSSSIDWTSRDGVGGTPIEQRDGREVTHVRGSLDGRIVDVQVTPDGAPVANFGFDVTPARLVTGLITERGVCPASEAGILGLFPERRTAPVAT